MLSFKISYPEELPVSARRQEIAQALQKHQVIIVSGETGSGKTTQLPKIVLEIGRGIANQGGLIGHTQPRRIAASSVAKRVAEELNTPLGEVVGYKVRFQDRLSESASVKVMTDGILLAEIQSDPDLKAYDTLIIDEAHERSLNIDFLLGYLRQLLPRRPDLKVVITSATIDADRFAEHFASKKGPAPVIAVSGRLYPVEIRYREDDDDEGDLNEQIAEAVDELWRNPLDRGDILVFLPGEGEIREAAKFLEKRMLNQRSRLGPIEVLPLFARLSQQEQDQIFHLTGTKRIVLATNVAETSLTVPGIRYVIDSGLARVKRYSYRNKVDQLLVEPISQAAANQRAGRCGRVANGICIRLYSEESYLNRPEFTDPEILRSSLAGVILKMVSIGLGAVDQFPFVEPPSGRAIADGYALLSELGAIDEKTLRLTAIGKVLARLPLDPRIGRMILEAKERGALAEVLVVAASMSVQDVRNRPLELQQQADQKHKVFDDDRSEFIGTIKLWQWLEQLRGRSLFTAPQEAIQAAAPKRHKPKTGKEQTKRSEVSNLSTQLTLDVRGLQPAQKLSNRQQEQKMQEFFIHPRRVREWRDVHTQLLTVVKEHRWKVNERSATYEQLHRSLLSGLLGNIGCKSEAQDWYLGARGIKFWIHPGANLSKKPGRWVMASELMQTSRLFGRHVANIQADWIEQTAEHLLKKQILDPHWRKSDAEVIALERATLYGLLIYHNRKMNYGRIDPTVSREIFIRSALVEGDWETKLPFLRHNQNVVNQVINMEHKARRQDLLVDDELIYAFYNQTIPTDVVSGHTFEVWYREAAKKDKKLLYLNQDELMRHEAAGITTEAFPKKIKLGVVECNVSYLHDPSDAKDGMTVTVPIYALNQVDEDLCEWLVPGMLKEKVLALLKSLHQKPRSRLMPLERFADEFIQTHEFAQGNLYDLLLKAVRQKSKLDVKRTDFRHENLRPHVFMNFIVLDEHGRRLGMGRDLTSLKAEHGSLARNAFQSLAALKVKQFEDESVDEEAIKPQDREVKDSNQPSDGQGHTTQERYTHWAFGELPELMEIKKGKQTLIGFPALVADGDAAHIEVYDEPEMAAEVHQKGLLCLIRLQIKEAVKYLERNIPDFQKMALLYMNLGADDDLRQQMVDVALQRAFLAEPWPHDEASFEQRIAEGRIRLQLIGQEVAKMVAQILSEYTIVVRRLKESRLPDEVRADIEQQLNRLMHKWFITKTSYRQLQHFPRYLKAITLRLEKYPHDPNRDEDRLKELRPLEQRYYRKLAEQKGKRSERMEDYRWMLEEQRVSFFAQGLKTPHPISIKRLDKAWALIQQV